MGIAIVKKTNYLLVPIILCDCCGEMIKKNKGLVCIHPFKSITGDIKFLHKGKCRERFEFDDITSIGLDIEFSQFFSDLSFNAELRINKKRSALNDL
jgi:hypothetical protein